MGKQPPGSTPLFQPHLKTRTPFGAEGFFMILVRELEL